MSDLLSRSGAELRAAFAEGTATPSQLLADTMARIEQLNPTLNAIAYLNSDEGAAAAAASDARWAAGQPLSPLDGIPVSIKDSINAVGTPWRHGSSGHRDVPLATVDAPPAARLKEAGAVIFAKTTMPDFGMMAAGISSLYGIVRNPWDPSRNTGGSSAGAGSSLAAGIGLSAIGTDIAGSVRLPAGHCGLVALKPTQGAIPHLAPSTMRSAGPMTRTVDDAEDLFDVISGADSRDLWSLPSYLGERRELTPRGLRIGVLTDLGYGERLAPEVESVVRQAADVLADGGADVREVGPLFDGPDPYPALDRVFQVRAYQELMGIAPERRGEVIPAVADWAVDAAALSAADYYRDLDAIASSAARVLIVTSAYDVILAPVIPLVGFGAEEVGPDPKHPLAHCGFTAWFNQTTQPASALCFGFSGGMPVGVQLAGARFADRQVLGLTRWLEANRPVAMNWPTNVAALTKENA